MKKLLMVIFILQILILTGCKEKVIDNNVTTTSTVISENIPNTTVEDNTTSEEETTENKDVAPDDGLDWSEPQFF